MLDNLLPVYAGPVLVLKKKEFQKV